MNLVKKISFAVATASALLPVSQAIALDDTIVDLGNYGSFGEPTETDVDPMAQVNSVFQLRDVAPSDWAFDALRNLVEKYNCLVGYPDGTFRGNRPLSRYEFAAGLNACLGQIEKMIAGDAGSVDTADIASLRKLVEEFEAELATLNARVDDLEGRVGFLEDHQFSTTTKLYGQVIFGLQGRNDSASDFVGGVVGPFALVGQDGIRESEDQANNISFGYNANLSLVTQFSDRSYLLTGLQAGNLNTNDTSLFGFNNSFTRLGYESDTNSDVLISDLTYRRLISDNLAMILGTAGVSPVNVFRGPSRVESAGYGPLSRFAQRNPIIQMGGGGAGVGFDWQATKRTSLQAVYAANFANNPNGGVFDDAYTAGIQALITPTKAIDLSLYYLKSYSGSNNGRLGMGVGDDLVALPGARLNTDAFGATANWAVSPKITLGTWVGFTDSDLVSSNTGGSVKTTNWMFSLEFPDLFKNGNYGAIFFGQPPRITDSDITLNGALAGNIPSFFEGNGGTTSGGRDDRSLHLEAFYRMQVTDNISITPGAIFVFNPSHSNGNDTIAIGALRTTFSF